MTINTLAASFGPYRRNQNTNAVDSFDELFLVKPLFRNYFRFVYAILVTIYLTSV